MSMFVPTGQRARLGEESRQALGMWPIANVSGGLGATSRPIDVQARVSVSAGGYAAKASEAQPGGGAGMVVWRRPEIGVSKV